MRKALPTAVLALPVHDTFAPPVVILPVAVDEQSTDAVLSRTCALAAAGL